MSLLGWIKDAWAAATRTTPAEKVPAWEELLPTAPRTFFAGKETLPFSGSAERNWTDAWLLAELSILAYWEPAAVRAVATQLEASWKIHFFPSLSDETAATAPVQAILLTGKDVAALAFRGTRLGRFPSTAEIVSLTAKPAINSSDLVLDLTAQQNADAARRVHGGMDAAYQRWKGENERFVAPLLAGKRQIYVAGHSLGGALAALAAHDQMALGNVALYTYGCPRFCDEAFAATYAGLPVYRFVHGRDFVTTVPPPGLILPRLRYTHVGGLIALDDAGSEPNLHGRQPELGDVLIDTITKTPLGVLENLAGIRFDQLGQAFNPLIRTGALSDHAPKYYAEALLRAAKP
jgi:hypothetical protein